MRRGVLGLGILLLLSITGSMLHRDMAYIEPAAGFSQRIEIRTTFQEAALTKIGLTEPEEGAFSLSFPKFATPPMVTGCRGASVKDRRCISVLVEQAGNVRLRLPPHPLGVPYQLENTWMEVRYF